MRKRLLLMSVLTMAILLACVACWWTVMVPSPKTTYSARELSVMKWLALHGDRSSNKRLFFHSAVVARNPDDAERWLLVGARRGDPWFMSYLCVMYSNPSSGFYSPSEAMKWWVILHRVEPEEAERIRNML